MQEQKQTINFDLYERRFLAILVFLFACLLTIAKGVLLNEIFIFHFFIFFEFHIGICACVIQMKVFLEKKTKTLINKRRKLIVYLLRRQHITNIEKKFKTKHLSQ